MNTYAYIVSRTVVTSHATILAMVMMVVLLVLLVCCAGFLSHLGQNYHPAVNTSANVLEIEIKYG